MRTTRTATTARERLLDALATAGSTITNGGTAATCPAHEDHAPSLSIGQRRDRDGVLVNCHAGCTADDVLAALGLTPADLFDTPREPSTNGRPVEVARYPYTDEAGVVLFEKVRMSPKTFRQCRQVDGRTVWSLQDARRVLYRLPDVLAAVRAGEPVYVAEGEKDADALARAGVVATTWTEGAWKADQRPKWRREYTDALSGAHVVIVADRDEPGRHTAATIAAQLQTVAASVAVVEPAEGKDAADHLAAGRTVAELVPAEPGQVFTAEQVDTQGDDEDGDALRRVILTSADTIKPRPVRWLWAGRIALGTLALLAGREGLGKSTLGYWLAARVTRGELPGEYHERPAGVLVAATEDSWEHTIVPRLIVAGADLSRVYRVEVENTLTGPVTLALPRDLAELEAAALRVGAALLLLDPLTSRLGELDTHRDAEVRQALEPLVGIADRAWLSVLGLMHHNKSGSVDPLQLVMGSKAFTAVARSVHTVVPDPDIDSVRLFGTPKNNLGTTDLPTLAFTLESAPVDTEEGTAWTGRLVWGEERHESIRDAMSRATPDDEKSATDEAAEWLEDYIASQGGTVASADAKRVGRNAGHGEKTLRRARERLRVKVESRGFPRVTYWSVTVAPNGAPGEAHLSEQGMTDATGPDLHSHDQVVVVMPSPHSPQGTGHDYEGATVLPTFTPPAGPGRCTVCGHHVETQGHRDQCPEREAS